MRGFYLDNSASSVASHFVSPELFTGAFGVRLRLFKPGKKRSLFLEEIRDLYSYSRYTMRVLLLYFDCLFTHFFATFLRESLYSCSESLYSLIYNKECREMSSIFFSVISHFI